ncbi:MAG: SRPBCC domain-containing protein [Anaerolineaceae bacterium]|nr:SRPBCC domain-containing protein [Anaerolineaceae bacterium]
MVKATIEHDIWIAVPREHAWRAITETAQLDKWWGAKGLVEIMALQPGATIKFATTDGPILATIQRVDPLHAFVYSWPPHPRYFSVPFVTSYTLEEVDGGTRVTLCESGFDA